MSSPIGTCRPGRPHVPATSPPPRPTGVRRVARPEWRREVVLLGTLYAIYEIGRMLSRDELPEAVANGWRVLTWEQTWHLDPERVPNQALTAVTPLAIIAAFFYSTLHYTVTPAVLVWMYRRHPEHYRSARTTLATACLVALVGFYALPTAPPRLLTGSGVRDTLAAVQHWGWWGGDGSVPKGLGGFTDQFAAMPSLHVGWAVWSGFLVARFAVRPVVRWIGASYPLLTTAVVLSTGNHYLLDAVAGAAVVGLGAVVTVGLPSLREHLTWRAITATAMTWGLVSLPAMGYDQQVWAERPGAGGSPVPVDVIDLVALERQRE